MKTVCPNCHHKYEIPEDYVGEILCENYKHKFSANKTKFCQNCEEANPADAPHCYRCSHLFQFSETDLEQESAPRENANAQYDKGMMYYKTRNYKKACEWFLNAAALEHEEAFSWYLKALEMGEKEAFNCYLKAAETGDVDAQEALGNMYYFGEGVEEDCHKAFNWYLKAAKKGNTGAQKSLGDMYRLKDRNYPKAFDWYLKAAELENTDAQEALGHMYHRGE
ncbi:MAG: hypothetical protein GX382_09785, partial [Syntrophomonadaceae bacterium]|nr:hypothetical protein [Syntrophomonadaceae bacterium]